MSLSSAAPWVIAASVVVAAGAVGAGLGFSGVLSSPASDGPMAAGIVDDRRVTAALCIEGPTVIGFSAGDRVLVVGRSADSDWLAVRNPVQLDQDVWLPRAVVSLDEDQSEAAAAVPIGGECPTITVAADAAGEPPPPLDSPESPEGPSGPDAPDTSSPPPPVPPAPDTSPPTLSNARSQHPTIACEPLVAPNLTTTAILVNAADNVGVSSVSVSWSGSGYGGQANASRSGATWSMTFDTANEPAGGGGPVTFVFTARDAAGNTSAASTVIITVNCIS